MDEESLGDASCILYINIATLRQLSSRRDMSKERHLARSILKSCSQPSD